MHAICIAGSLILVLILSVFVIHSGSMVPSKSVMLEASSIFLERSHNSATSLVMSNATTPYASRLCPQAGLGHAARNLASILKTSDPTDTSDVHTPEQVTSTTLIVPTPLQIAAGSAPGAGPADAALAAEDAAIRLYVLQEDHHSGIGRLKVL